MSLGERMGRVKDQDQNDGWSDKALIWTRRELEENEVGTPAG